MKQNKVTLHKCMKQFRKGNRAVIHNGEVTEFESGYKESKIYELFGIIGFALFLFFVIFGLPVLMVIFDDCITARAEDKPYRIESTAYYTERNWFDENNGRNNNRHDGTYL